MSNALFTKAQKVGVLLQSAWDSVSDETANFKTCNLEAGAIPDPGVVIDEFNYTSAYGPVSENNRIRVDTTTGLKMLPFRTPATKALLAPYLAGFFHNVTEAATTPYAKTFTFRDFVNGSPINFGNDEGVLHSVAQGTYNNGSDTGDGTVLQNAIVNNLKLIVDFNATGNGRLMWVEGDWIGNQMISQKYLSGTWVAMPTTGYYSGFSFDTLTVNGVDYSGVCIKSVTFEFKNNVTPSCITTKANDYDIMPEMITTIELVYDSVSQAAFNIYRNAGTNGVPYDVAFDFRNGTPTTDGNIAIAVTKGVLMENPIKVDGDKFGISLVVKATRPDAGWGNIVTMTDTIDWGY